MAPRCDFEGSNPSEKLPHHVSGKGSTAQPMTSFVQTEGLKAREYGEQLRHADLCRLAPEDTELLQLACEGDHSEAERIH